MPILFFSEAVQFKIKHPRKTSKWIIDVIEHEKMGLDAINYIFCSDKYLHSLNLKYLNHDTYTDIITFDNSDGSGVLLSDIYISIDRVKDNSKKLKIEFEIELYRVMVHGVLHLLGYKDKTKREKTIMRNKENAYLSLWNLSFVPRET